MKHIVSTVLLATSLAATSAQALNVGLSAGYLVDAEEEYIAARVGTEFSSTQAIAHSGEFEIGFTSQSEGIGKADYMPLMLNYRGELKNTGKFEPFFGAGAGMARTKIKINQFNFSDSDWSFSAQAFCGVSYKVTETARISLMARYIWIDDVKFLSQEFEVGDDLAVELGVHFRF